MIIKQRILVAVFSFFVAALIVSADTSKISKLEFVTEDLTVMPGEISEAITVQTRNAAGESEQVSETNDVSFKSSSGTGSFLNSSGNPVSTTMSKGTASRTFYYRDSKEGTHTLTVTIKGRESGQEFEASREISVSSDSSGKTATSSDENTSQSETADEDDASENDSSDNSAAVSSHSSQTSSSGFALKADFKAEAGRKRTVTVNSPIGFKAHTQGLPVNIKGPVYQWTFGDGFSAYGEAVNHTYLYPGDYNVVLNVEVGDRNAVSRTVVNVVEGGVVISQARSGPDGFAEVRNNSNAEINIQGWQITSDQNAFSFPTDTIISSKAGIKVPFAGVSSANSTLALLYPNGKAASSYDFQEKMTETAREKPSLEPPGASMQKAPETSNDAGAMIKALEEEIRTLKALLRLGGDLQSGSSTALRIKQEQVTKDSGDKKTEGRKTDDPAAAGEAVAGGVGETDGRLSSESADEALMRAFDKKEDSILRQVFSLPQKGFASLMSVFSDR